MRVSYTGGMAWDAGMEVALRLAREAAAEREVPVGAVVLDAAGQVIGRGRNLREADAIRWPMPRSRP